MTDPISIEVSAADVETAISKGVAELGVSRDAVMVEVLEEAGRRLLGLGARQARVRLTVIRAPAAPPPPARVEPEAAPPASADAQAAERSASRRREKERAKDSAETATAPAPRPRREKKASAAELDAPAAPAMPATPELAAVSAPPAVPASFEEDEAAEEGAPVSDADLAEEMRAGADVLRKLLSLMGIEAEVTGRRAQAEAKEPQHYLLEIQGRELGALIGRRGETLAALQYLTRLLTSRVMGRRVHLVVDVEGYKARREQMLRRLAQRMAEQAVQRGRTVSMEPMPPHERRIVHLALREHPDVTTESVGEGDHRKVTVVPRRPKP
ncbi:MAG: Jag N-terminal domain-containing protein [Anaerolineae bacterium]|nr:Jag N-terminal domain-containing protein [Anaerolineae bacterium]